MPLKTRQEYIDSLRAQRKRVFLFGEQIDDPVDHPMIRPSLNAVAMTYELAQQEEHFELMTARSSLTGERVNRFTHLQQGADNLVSKIKMHRLLLPALLTTIGVTGANQA